MAEKPQLKVLMDLSDGLTVNETSALCYDISDIVLTAHTRRGRNREIDKIEAGYCVITIIDDNGDFNPDNTDSPYYGKLVPGKKLRLYPEYNDGTGSFRYPDIFTGYISNYTSEFSIGVDVANKVTIEAYDGMKIFNSVSIVDVVNSTTDDTSDERINAILDEIDWPLALQDLEVSTVNLDADPSNLRTVLDALRQVEDTEAGLIYFDGSGIFQFKNRATVNTLPDFADAYKFSDNGVDTSYNDISFRQNDSNLFNEITVISYNGTDEVTVTNTTSQDTYFVRSAERSDVLLSATSDLEDLADTLLQSYEEPSLEIASITLNLTDYTAIDRLVAAFYFEIFFIPLFVEKTMPGDTTISRLSWVQGVNHDITPNNWIVTAFTGSSDVQTPIPIFIASEDSGEMYHSRNGKNWTSPTIKLDGSTSSAPNIQGIIYNEGLFVGYIQRKTTPSIVALKMVWSEDGVNWTTGSITTDDFAADDTDSPITYGNGYFMFLTLGPSAFYSSDGKTWTETPIFEPSGPVPLPVNYVGMFGSGISYMDNEYTVALRNSLFPTTRKYYPVVSSTLTGWAFDTSIEAPRKVIKVNNKYIAIFPSTIQYSSDNANWSTAKNCGINQIEDFLYADGIYIAVGTDGMSWSTNLDTWTDSNITTDWQFAVSYGRNMYVSGGNAGAYYSRDGKTWTLSDLTTPGVSDNVRSICSRPFDNS